MVLVSVLRVECSALLWMVHTVYRLTYEVSVMTPRGKSDDTMPGTRHKMRKKTHPYSD